MEPAITLTSRFDDFRRPGKTDGQRLRVITNNRLTLQCGFLPLVEEALNFWPFWKYMAAVLN